MAPAGGVSPLTVNRLSIYLRVLRQLAEQGEERISSQQLASRYDLSAAQIRKDLAQFGEFGIRGVGYDVRQLAARLEELLGLDRRYPLVIVGMGNLGRALAHYLEFNSGSFEVVAGVDNDPRGVGRAVGRVTVRPSAELAELVRSTGAVVGVLTVPPEAAQENLDALAAAGVRAVLNFAPGRLRAPRGVRLKNVDLRIHLEELAFYLGAGEAEKPQRR
jgi:redox-sensing transcriptional repressor